MTLLLVFLLVAALSVLASHPRLLEVARPFHLAQLSASGLVFVALGALVGPTGLRLWQAADLSGARPLVQLGLGLGGLLIGLNLDLRLLRSLPLPVYWAAGAHSLTAFLVVAAPGALLLTWLLGAPWPQAVGGAAALGAAASVSSAHLAILWYRTGRMDRLRGLSVSLLATLDDLTSLLVLAAALAFGASARLSSGLALVGLALAIGFACGALIAFLMHRTRDDTELMSILLGGVALISGAAAYLKLSTLLSGLVCGATLAVVGGQSIGRVYRVLSRVERPAFLVLVFLVGAHVELRSLWVWAALPLFVGLRFVGKLFGGRLASRSGSRALTLLPQLGYALLAQGGVSLCVLTEYLLLVNHPTAHLVFSVGVLGAIANEVLASQSFHRSLVPHATT